MNKEKLKKMETHVRIGGKGTPRRKKKAAHSTNATDERKFKSCLKKVSLNPITSVEEVNIIKDDGSVIHFINPKTEANFSANTYAITGYGENKQIKEMLPDILNQLSLESQIKLLVSVAANGEDEEDVPDLVENFDEASKVEVAKPGELKADKKPKKKRGKKGKEAKNQEESADNPQERARKQSSAATAEYEANVPDWVEIFEDASKAKVTKPEEPTKSNNKPKKKGGKKGKSAENLKESADNPEERARKQSSAVAEDEADVRNLVENFDEASKAEFAKPEEPKADEKPKEKGRKKEKSADNPKERTKNSKERARKQKKD